MKTLLTATTVLLAWASLLGTAMGAPPPGPPPGGGGGGGGDVVTVDCPGDSLQAALDEAKERDTFNVSGTCNERITVSVDRITIDGGGSAIIDGTDLSAPGALLRVRALNVSILNLTVQNGPRSGIAVGRGGSAIIQGVTSTDNGNHGISVNRSSYALIGPEGRVHPLVTGDPPSNQAPPGNHIFENDGHGIIVTSGANADIFHNLITGNRRGINISTNGSAGIDGNVITGNSQAGIQFFNNGAVNLSTDANHHDTVGDGAPVGSIENNLIEKNREGLLCRRGGAAQGNLQNFGDGNPGTGLTPHSDDAVIPADEDDDNNECHARSTVFE